MSKKNILFILAHYDDEAFVMGLINKRLERGSVVHIAIVCGTGINDGRRELFNSLIYNKLCNNINIIIHTFVYKDLELSNLISNTSELNTIREALNNIILNNNIDTVVTHSDDDIHEDHRIVNEVVKIVIRPHIHNLNVLTCYIPGSSSDHGIFNYILPLGNSDMIKKINYLKNYKTYLNSANNIKAVKILSKYHGSLNGYKNVEIYKPIRISYDIR